MFQNIAQQIKNLIDQSEKFIIVSHENPDGDAIGSAIALSRYLTLIGKKPVIWFPGRFPAYYRWMTGSGNIRYYADSKDDMLSDLKTSDALFAVDISCLSRTGIMHDPLTKFNGKRVLIDHHINPDTEVFDLIFSDVTVSSTCELIYHLIRLIDDVKSIDCVMAEALYVGIMTDTGSFSFNCNLPETYEIVAGLIRIGISPDRIHKLVYDNNSEHRIRLLGLALQKMKIIHEYKAAYISLNSDELKQMKSQPGDTEGIVNFALSIKGIVLAAFFSVRDNEVKISFRSKGRFSVNDFARNHFNGGGHLNAAGGTFSGSVESAVEIFESLLPIYKNELSSHDEGY